MSNGKVLVGALAGLAAGVAIGLILGETEMGKSLKNSVSGKANRLSETLKDLMDEGKSMMEDMAGNGSSSEGEGSHKTAGSSLGSGSSSTSGSGSSNKGKA
ncbi:MAG: hypothetical protein U0T73_12635 [Chitinophagales bacterium]